MAILKVKDENGNVIDIPAISGRDGHTPIRGTDYWTAEDKQEIVAEVLAEVPSGGGGTSGTNNYQDLINKPSINGVTLQGDVTTEQLGIQDGKDGQNGQDGKDGSNGYTYTPTVSPEGILSWTNDGGLLDPEPVDIRGPRGEQGVQGEAGSQGEIGPQGPSGQDGFTPTIVLTNVEDGVEIAVTNQDGITTATIHNGQQGIQGPIGETGATGPRGEKGDSGVSGVYVGSGDMPEGYNIQIDPDGSATDFVDLVLAALENGDEVAY